ncbi:alpha amylase N-terminal ig-like domain-containing protein [Bacillus paranthracis]
MLKDAIYHRPKIITHTLTMKKRFISGIRTKRDDVQSTNLIYGDPYEWTDGKWISSSAPMKKTGSTALFDYWSISIEPKFKRLRYGFELKAETETLIYAERGFFSQHSK